MDIRLNIHMTVIYQHLCGTIHRIVLPYPKTNEEYIYAGCYGESGRIKDKITIPTNCYKIIVVLPEGENDLKKFNRKTRIIAVDMPNDATVSGRWRTYLTTRRKDRL